MKKFFQIDDFFPSYFDDKVFRKSVVGAVSFVLRSRHKAWRHKRLHCYLHCSSRSTQQSCPMSIQQNSSVPHFPLNLSHSIDVWFVFQPKKLNFKHRNRTGKWHQIEKIFSYEVFLLIYLFEFIWFPVIPHTNPDPTGPSVLIARMRDIMIHLLLKLSN